MKGKNLNHRALKHILALSLIFTALNCVKPVHMDDWHYYVYAKQIADHPLDPYGFEVAWFQWPEPAIDPNATLFLSYWIAAGLKLFGDQPTLLKAWLFPFNLLFVLGIYGILRRFVRGFEKPLLWMTVLSPAFLPSVNLMLDIPVLAMILAALNLFIMASDRHSPKLALSAGVVAGLAMQVKYSALIAPPLILLYALIFRKMRIGWLAAVVAGTVFIAWEGIIFLKHGQSHFLIQIGKSDIMHYRWPRLELVHPMLNYLGGLAVTLSLLGPLAMQGHWRKLASFMAALVIFGFALLLFSPSENLVFLTFGLMLWTTTLTAAWSLARVDNGHVKRTWDQEDYRKDAFLVLWLLLELLAFFVITPFPATRRCLGLVIAITFVMGRYFACNMRREKQRWSIVPVSAFTILLGLGFFAVDLQEAIASKRAAKQSAEIVHNLDKNPVTWYVGHWGFKYYAEREGMKAVVPDKSQLCKGDWLVVPVHGVFRQQVFFDPDYFEFVEELHFDDFLPLQTVPHYYLGSIPLSHRHKPRISIVICRVVADNVPMSNLPAETVIQWAKRKRRKTAQAAIPALVRALESEHADIVKGAKEALLYIGTPALVYALGDADPEVRRWAASTLGTLGTEAKDAIPALEHAFLADEEGVRNAASESLRQIKRDSLSP